MQKLQLQLQQKKYDENPNKISNDNTSNPDLTKF